ncbi:hypothetical protein [Thiothrix fructosivorans]|uniref:Uncharacterized protein n=1 Tax=Thiothrix fructosivorans TaxID=111770 RepID=A0A8B0SVU6_9GAMM|nr:hypothetical protein [Thiothrix fructosivorans]MBO0611363.1 hypothetical protein [Thiothrix fructosivorans]QTX13102.1 hypothetical protein J1836_021005 [Thiothrix fructosivorans]
MNKTLLAALLPLFVVGCAATPDKTALQAQGISTDGASKVAFRNVRVEGTTLKGSLKRIGRNPVHFGHLDYTVTDTSGKALQSGQTDYSGAIKQRRSPNASRFSIPLKQAWQPGLHHATLVWDDKTHQQ